MAILTLNSIIKIPTTATFNNVAPAIPFVRVSFGISDTVASTNLNPVSPLTQSQLIFYIGNTFLFSFGVGGSYTFTTEVVGSNNVHTIVWLIDDSFSFFPTFVACEDSYTFEAGLTPSTVYYVVIENNRNKRYVQQVTTDGSGDFSIDATAPEFPVGFFIPEQFKYTLKVYSNSTLMNQEDITIGTTIYNCITLGFVNTVTTTASANFGVDFLIDDELNVIVDDLGNTFSAND